MIVACILCIANFQIIERPFDHVQIIQRRLDTHKFRHFILNFRKTRHDYAHPIIRYIVGQWVLLCGFLLVIHIFVQQAADHPLVRPTPFLCLLSKIIDRTFIKLNGNLLCFGF